MIRWKRCSTGLTHVRAVLLMVMSIFLLQGCVTQEGLNLQAKDALIKKGIDIPTNVPLGVYVPEVRLQERFYISSVAAWMTPGEDMRAAIERAGTAYFGSMEFIDADRPSDTEFGMFVSFDPDWDFDAGKIIMNLGYRFYDADGNLLKSGTQTVSKAMGPAQATTGFYNSALKTAQLAMVRTINSVFADGRTFVDRIASRDVDRNLLVNMDDTIRTGTAFFISDTGQLLTAAHVVEGCLRSQVEFDGGSHEVAIKGQSVLLDVALLQSDVVTEKYLPMRAEPKIVLGERISSAGFPLANVLAPSANLTVGNVSSMQALPGSMGKFQFSAPVQPGSSGGPLISEKGELIGMTTGSLNVSAMAKRGIVPQNVNFALEGKHIIKFVERHGGDIRWYDERTALPDVAAVNEHLAASVAQVACYQ